MKPFEVYKQFKNRFILYGCIVHAMGVDSAMNIDGGGSSAMYYKGSYKVGHGRALPNAVIFDE